MDTQENRKSRGAFFTPPEISRYLARWAIRSPNDVILEPSCGEASFLLAAGERLRDLDACPLLWSSQLHGVEIHEDSAVAAKSILRDANLDASVTVSDFFDYDERQKFDAIVGNPPFVRYQQFSGAARAKSLEAALAQGVRLSGLASSWAGFVLKASQHVSECGRLALVLPAELLSVSYAAEVRNFLLRRFAHVRLIMFEQRVFPEVLEEVVLLLAEGSGGAKCFEVYQTRNAQTLQDVEAAEWTEHAPAVGEKWTPALVAKNAFAAYREIASLHFEDLGSWGRTYLGAVTGNNKFFTLSANDLRKHGLTQSDVIPISPPGSRHMRGLTFTDAAWRKLSQDDSRTLLFYPGERPSEPALRYIKRGEESSIAEAYKCRMRSPWWRVPLVEIPDLFLTYMNHDRPRLITNSSKAHILNSIYGVKLKDDRRSMGRELLPIASLNSVTLLGAEIVGRAYGGGLLKMEPREADLLPVPSFIHIRSVEKELRAIKSQLTRQLRQGNVEEAAEAVDSILLANVTKSDLEALRAARDVLFQRRRARGKNGKD
ncbi:MULTISPECIES: N-6 DNA methylase [unclassified Sphingopyxis]|uniref:HsdM family class I SAM-dependent methyltransferase n=1 Tax=Alphaproteobacteria TaxID=28211 RepID=UPI002855FDC6|nr:MULTISPECIES: N-6 DNA methylase [unclassified Sphingopyxis]MDR7060836.1 adenine-specific DNA methylase [Sphingopyxis sp. BE235]MDR7181293.1 adenine-specific DNA methylase [Sphingopyxis sp. BE249]